MTDGRLIVFLALTFAWCLSEASAAPRRAQPVRPAIGPRWLPRAVGVAILVSLMTSVVEHAARGACSIDVLTVVGAGTMLTGAAVRRIAILALGPWFLDAITITPRQPLVTTGIYGVVRHPSETGSLCLVLGGALVLGSSVGLGTAMLVVLPTIVWRTMLEDRLLAERFGRAYALYAHTVPALVPCCARLVPGDSQGIRSMEGADP